MPHFKRILSLFLALCLCFGFVSVSAVAADGSGSLGNFAKNNVWNDSLFDDVAETDWFNENIRSVYEYGLMVGKGEGSFAPSASVSVAEILTVAARLHAVYHTGSDAFAPTDPWYACYAAYCVENGIVSSLPEEMNAPAARGLVAEILCAALPQTEYEAINSVKDGSIPDVAADDVFGPAVYRLYRAGIMVGNDEAGTFAPYSDVKRSEVAAILTRIIDKPLRKNITLPVSV
ncbi:MAG: S-layer homology domain-containing protein [Clostridia bacterium]|nr:S-layer homology domain-containing protein [Clostridia bacterium]